MFSLSLCISPESAQTSSALRCAVITCRSHASPPNQFAYRSSRAKEETRAFVCWTAAHTAGENFSTPTQRDIDCIHH
ncbi:hypothetical protein DPEC_G00342800 [Dallia pectoralis]|uniref:Uncharacterized protein n=1 Tax=Dallia pectoralis TaxID=75939 RepID=A0ACC2F5W0_DALPE|nr:hypothetical protein DPEC_G00342800 [Dallia pectoralis]